MKSIWLVYEQNNVKRNRFFIDQWFLAAEEQNAQISLVNYEDLTFGMKDGKAYLRHGEGKKLPDAAVMRLNQPLLSLQFEKMGIPVFNNAHVASIANDKRLTHQMMSGLVPAMDTVFRGMRESPLPCRLSSKPCTAAAEGRYTLPKTMKSFVRR